MDTANLFRLDGRVALVTGGSRGIGKMIAAGSIAQGAKVYVSSRRRPPARRPPPNSAPIASPCPQDVDRRPLLRAGGEVGQYEEARHPRQRRRRLGCAVRGVSGKRLGQGHGPDVLVALLPDAGAAPAAEGGRQSRAAGQGHQHHLDPRPAPRSPADPTMHRSRHRRPDQAHGGAAGRGCDQRHLDRSAPGAFASEMNRAARDHGDEVARSIPARRIGVDEDIGGDGDLPRQPRGRLRDRRDDRGGRRGHLRLHQARHRRLRNGRGPAIVLIRKGERRWPTPRSSRQPDRPPEPVDRAPARRRRAPPQRYARQGPARQGDDPRRSS
ncbi:hypothetical protein AB5I41_06395 [Sphingomonas sp. MMS24-JH45]